MKNTEEYNRFIQEILSCKKCPLWKSRRNPVPGEGPVPSDMMIIGEAPGKNEDITGRPFVGKAGQLLTRMLEASGIPRKTVYITNIVKCRPPENRVPTTGEVKTCLPYLEKQILIVNPEKILILGRTAARYLAGEKIPLRHIPKEKKLEELRGRKLYLYLYHNKIPVVVSYHPAAILRNPRLKSVFKQDIELFKKI